MNETIPYGFSIKSKSSFNKYSYTVKDLGSMKNIMEVTVTKGVKDTYNITMYDKKKEMLLRAYKTGMISPKYILKREGDNLAEFWTETDIDEDNSGMQYMGKIITNKSKDQKRFHFTDDAGNCYFNVEMNWGSRSEYLLEVTEIIDPIVAILGSCILHLNYK